MSFQRVCSTKELSPGEVRRLEDAGEAVALFNVDGDFYAIADTCSHGAWSLSDGYLEGDRIECSLHMAEFCVRTGKACKLPATEPVRVFLVKVIGEDVLVDFASGHLKP